MADFVLKKKHSFTFAIEDDEGTVFSLPSIKSLSFEDGKALVKIDEEDDLVKKGGMIRDFITRWAPGIADKNIADMEFIDIFNAYAMAEGERNLGESKASPVSSKNTARR